jgi:1,3-beta-glucan synthase
MSLLFFAFNLLPSFFAFLIDEGLSAAIRKPLKAICTFSPFFFVMQSRCIGHYFSNEFAVGGAKYVSTGRGLAITHTAFHEIYVTHAASCIYPGVEILFLLIGTIVLALSSGNSLNPWSVGFASITPAALLLGPSLFNPHAFGTPEGIQDLHGFGRWLFRAPFGKAPYNACHSWADYYQEFADSRRSVKTHAFLLPSKEMLLSLPLLLARCAARVG